MSASAASPPFSSFERQSDAARLGMWVFLGTEVLFFGPLFAGYIYARLHFGDAIAEASRHTHVILGTVNTAVLLTSSFTMAVAVEVARQKAFKLARTMLWITAALGVAFLVIKGVEYTKEWNEHLVPGLHFAFDATQRGGAELFFYLYFATTGLHALHLTIAIGAVLVMAHWFTRRGAEGAEKIEVTGLYWHFVDIVWIFLYPIIYLVGRSG
jgi:cytochrome c oxidase subunit 3